jgi:hypothetical protein
MAREQRLGLESEPSIPTPSGSHREDLAVLPTRPLNSGGPPLFGSAQRNRLQVLHWDGGGLWVSAKLLPRLMEDREVGAIDSAWVRIATMGAD